MTEPVDSVGELRSKLVRRLAIASSLVVFLMATLALFDYLSTPDEPEVPVFNEPVPVPPKKEISQPVTPAENLPEPPAPAAPTPEAKPAEEAVPPAPPPAPAAAPSAAPLPAQAGPAPAPARTVPQSSRPATRHAEVLPQPKPEKPAPLVPESSGAPAVAMPPVTSERAYHPPAREMLVPKAQREANTFVIPNVSRLFSGFVLQAGVFSSAQRAEELHARLTLSGIPSAMETRVQIGPFRTRQEAEAAQDKLKSLGVETVLVPPKGAAVRH